MEDVYRTFLGGWARRQELLARAQEKGAGPDSLRVAEAKQIDLETYVLVLEAGASDEELHAAVDAGILPTLYVRALKVADHEQIMEAHGRQIAKSAIHAWGLGRYGYAALLEKGATHDRLLSLDDRQIEPRIALWALESGLGIAELLEAHDQGLRDADLLCYVQAKENDVDPGEVLAAHRRGLRGLDLSRHLRSLGDR